MGQLKFTVLQDDVHQGEFDCGVQSINDMIVNSYFVTLLQHCYAYKVTSDDQLLGYCMVMLQNVDISKFPQEQFEEFDPTFCEVLPTMYIKYLAIEESIQRNGIGTIVLEGLIQMIRKYAEKLPIRVITIDAMNHLVNWYSKEGFKRMPKNKAGQEGTTTYMYLDCLKNPEKLAEYISNNCNY